MASSVSVADCLLLLGITEHTLQHRGRLPAWLFTSGEWQGYSQLYIVYLILAESVEEAVQRVNIYFSFLRA
jgi:hypothetical protein